MRKRKRAREGEEEGGGEGEKSNKRRVHRSRTIHGENGGARDCVSVASHPRGGGGMDDEGRAERKEGDTTKRKGHRRQSVKASDGEDEREGDRAREYRLKIVARRERRTRERDEKAVATSRGRGGRWLKNEVIW